MEKKRAYDQSVTVQDVESGTFGHIAYSATSGTGPTAVTSYKCLTGMFSERSK